MRSLSESCINVCDVFFVVFSSKILLTLVKLCNCNQQRDLFVQDADYESSASYACQKS